MKHKILLAAVSERACDMLRGLIDPEECMVVTATDGETLRCIDLSGFDIIILSPPLDNEEGTSIVFDLREKTNAPIIMLVKAELAAKVREKVKPTGAYVVEKPLGKGSIMQAIHFLEMHAENEVLMRQLIADMEKQAEEQQAVYRAKLILIGKGMTEEEAHRHLQQRAMDERHSLRFIAETIISEN